jgi:putative membrane protein
MENKHNEASTTSEVKNQTALEATLYALERTLLAWVRTSLALLGSGIAIDKGMEYIHQTRVLSGTALFENAHMIGIVLSCFSTLLLLLSTLFSYQRLASLADQLRIGRKAIFPVMATSFLVIILGATISILLLAS